MHSPEFEWKALQPHRGQSADAVRTSIEIIGTSKLSRLWPRQPGVKKNRGQETELSTQEELGRIRKPRLLA